MIGRPPVPLRVRFERLVSRPTGAAAGDECWLWTGCKDRSGHGKIQLARGDVPYGRSLTMRATRVGWFLTTGAWPRPDQYVLHSCDNPSCVNPSHHFLGDHHTNMTDMASKGRSAGARGTWRGGVKSSECAHKAKLNWDLVGQIRQKFATGNYTMAALGREYHVDECTIGNVVRFETWVPSHRSRSAWLRAQAGSVTLEEVPECPGL